MSYRPYTLFAAITSLVLGSLSVPALGQVFPNKPVRIIVPTTPGGLSDTIARLTASGMAKHLGQAVVVENKPGANQMIGYEYVAKQVPADGYTLVTVTVPNLVTLPATVKDLKFDPFKDLEPVIGIAEARLALASSSQMPWKTFNEMVAYAKVNPGKVNYGSASPLIHLQTGGLVRELALNTTHVPYSNTAAFILGIVRGDVHIGFMSESSMAPVIAKLNVLAVTGNQRTTALPNVPTFVELGIGKMKGVSYSLNAPAATPKATIEKLYTAAAQALREPDIRARFQKAKVDILATTSEVAAKSAADDGRFFADVAKKIGIVPE